MNYVTYVVKLDKFYIRFGSYSKATTIDNPLKATMYSSKKLAEIRLSGSNSHYINNKPISNKKFKIVKLTFKLESET